MPRLSEYAFHFQSQAVAQDTFTVVSFQGEEGLSELYRFEVLLVSEQADLNLEAILQAPATLTIKGNTGNGDKGDLPFHGILASFEQLHQADSWVFYRAVLRPKLWWLTLTHHNQVFLDQKIDDFLGDVLQDGGLSPGLDFDFQLKGSYPSWDYLCQYNESHFAFVSRWMERDGLYYWFEQSDQGEKMIASDTLIAHGPLPGHDSFLYGPPTGLDAPLADQVIKTFTLKRSPMPRNLLLKDYNYEKPSLDLTSRAQVANKGRGEIYIYGEHFLDIAEGNRLAQVRAEEFKCREQLFQGLSTVPALRPGYVFTLERHYRTDFNQRYLTIGVRHEGSQESYLLSGLGISGLAETDNLFYRNHFECIPASVQFRPRRVTERARIHGNISAKIDASGSGKYAELDQQGRYKVKLPYDLSGRGDGKASAYIRMMQPYAGQDMGMHAPLHKGTEVLLAFLEGDPDRPVIAGAIPNPETASPVTSANQTMVRLKSGGGNVIHMEDEEGSQRILMHSPTAGSFIRVGYKNDPDDPPDNSEDPEDPEEPVEPEEPEEENNKKEVDDPQGDCMHDNTQGIKIKSEKTLTFESGDSCTIVHGDEFTRINGDERYIIDGSTEEMVGGFDTTMVGGNVFEGIAGAKEDVTLGFVVGLSLAGAFELESIVKGECGLGWKWTFHEMKEKFHIEEDKVGALKNELQGEISALIGDHNKLVANMTMLCVSTEQLAAEVSTLAVNSEALCAAVNEINGDKNEVAGSILEAVGESTSAIGSRTSVLGEAIQIAGDKTQILGIEEKI
ncbi:type VI secretion system Vgr family protein [Thiorhodovibrio winogradskyi]|uniref:Type VI secretion system Vgr family protein n=1 Tax=Thiorhodovibrio winogradskyi TaxID=77007 RepID=A0ABZ0S8M2_9GAMM|nr:type VI secretion system tip protein TssI/VgrG [Thiorhodovibrio winogradskyi]